MTAILKRPRGRPKDEDLKSRRQEEILDVSAKVFARLGFPNTDVQVIADQLGVGKGTIYRYFPTKRDLFLATVERGVRRLQQATDAHAASATDPLDRIVAAIYSYLEFFGENPEMVELFIQERAEFKDRRQPAYFAIKPPDGGPWRDMFRGLVAAGRIRDLPFDRLSDVVGDLLYGTIFANYFAGRKKSFREQASDVVDLVFQGILTDKERACWRNRKK